MKVIIAKIGRWPKAARQSTLRAVLGFIVLALVTACDFSGREGVPAPRVVVPNEAKGFVGGAVADEPHAVLVARDVLAVGGTAADAAVALYFTLAVTYPINAGLGGGGSCLVYKPGKEFGTDVTEVLEFASVASKLKPRAGGQASALPTAVRGMAALHARYGAVRWGNLLAPSEQMARLGFEVSRALVQDLNRNSGASDDEAARGMFAGSSGKPLAEGDRLMMLDLAGVIAQLRLKGAGDFYVGGLAQRLVASVEAIGGTLSLDELRAVTPNWRPTASFTIGKDVLHTAPNENGLSALRLFAVLADKDRYTSAPLDERPHLMAEASQRARSAKGAMIDPTKIAALMSGYSPARHASLAEKSTAAPVADQVGTSFAVVDRAGMAVACTVTLNRRFGTGRVAPGLGLLLAATSGDSDPAAFFVPALLVNHNTHQVLLAAAASSGAVGSSALATVLRGLLIEQQALPAALAAPRIHNSGVPDLTAIEPGLAGSGAKALEARGHHVNEGTVLGQVSAIACLGGLPRSPETCAFASDPRGFGLGVGGVF